ncbi:unnamed protein product, partial [Ectocarpus sp. 12 AP-2014]
SRGAACHQRALGLTYQLLASSPELMSLALEPRCPLFPAVLDALGDGGGGGLGGDASGSRSGMDGSGSSHHHHNHRRITSGGGGDGGGGGGVPGTPRSAPRTPRLAGMSGDGRRMSRTGGAADSEAAGRSGLAVLRIVGLVAAAFVDGRLPKPSSLLLGSSGGGGRGTTVYTPGPAIMVQVQPENTPTRAGGGAAAASGDLDDSGSGSGDGRRDQGLGGSAHSSALVSSGASARRARAGSGAKENQERRAKLLADLGDGTVLVSWANTGVEEIIAARRVLLSSSNSLTSRARRSLARNSLFRTM